MNRLRMSVNSGIPSQMDWALARLCTYSQQLGDRFLFSDYNGLDDALVRFVLRLSAALRHTPRSEWDTDSDGYATQSNQQLDQGIGAPGENGGMGLRAASVQLTSIWPQADTKDPDVFSPESSLRDARFLRRALTATLVLRNMVFSTANAAQLARVPGVLQAVLTILQKALPTTEAQLRLDTWADLRVNLLDILESLASRIVLSEWIRTAYLDVGLDVAGAPTRTEDAVFVLLHSLLHTTHDRAILLASLRCLRAIASNEANASVLIDATPTLHRTPLGFTARCLALLPLTQDPELLEAAVDLLYQVIATGENALLLGTLTVADVCEASNGYAMGLVRRAFQPDTQENVPPASVPLVHAVLGYFVRTLSLGKSVWERDSPLTVSESATPWLASVPSVAKARRDRERERREQKEKASPQERAAWRTLSDEELDRIRHINEPERGIEWYVLCTYPG